MLTYALGESFPVDPCYEGARSFYSKHEEEGQLQSHLLNKPYMDKR